MDMEIISSNEWQDCYRIVEGYLFIVNKFREKEMCGATYKIPRNYYKKVSPNSKGRLWILTRPVKYYGGYNHEGKLKWNEENGEFPVGSVFFEERPVEKIDNPYFFNCYPRAAYNNLCGSIKYWDNNAKEIQKIMNLYMDDWNKWFNEDNSFYLKKEDAGF